MTNEQFRMLSPMERINMRVRTARYHKPEYGSLIEAFMRRLSKNILPHGGDRYTTIFELDVIYLDPKTGEYEYWKYDNETKSHYFSHIIDINDEIPESEDFEYYFTVALS